MKQDSLEILAEQITRASADRVQQMTCPSCGGSLVIQVAKTRRVAMSVLCPQCMGRVVCDGLPEEPPWVAVLGPKVTTKAKAVASPR